MQFRNKMKWKNILASLVRQLSWSSPWLLFEAAKTKKKKNSNNNGIDSLKKRKIVYFSDSLMRFCREFSTGKIKSSSIHLLCNIFALCPFARLRTNGREWMNFRLEKIWHWLKTVSFICQTEKFIRTYRLSNPKLCVQTSTWNLWIKITKCKMI